MNYTIKLNGEQICEADTLYDELKKFIQHEIINDIVYHLACEACPGVEIDGQDEAEKIIRCEGFTLDIFNIEKNGIEACGTIRVRNLKTNISVRYNLDFTAYIIKFNK